MILGGAIAAATGSDTLIGMCIYGDLWTMQALPTLSLLVVRSLVRQ